MIHAPIVLLTDFGLEDPYAGIMKGVIDSIIPGAKVIDLTHQIPPGDIRRGAVILWQSIQFFPAGSIFVSVVDPGVGTSRKPILIKSGDLLFIGPDNGLFTYVIAKNWQAWTIENPDFLLKVASGNTFHGRDIFAPAAAHLHSGQPCSSFGNPLEKFVRLADPICAVENLDGHTWCIRGESLHADHFGNVLTSIGSFKRGQKSGEWLFQNWIGSTEIHPFSPDNAVLHVSTASGEIKAPLYPNFQTIPEGKIGGLIGSSGLLEIAANRGSAQDTLQDSHCLVELIISND